MSTDSKASPTKSKKPQIKVVVTVNGKPVGLEDHSVTGLEVKQAAIAQGVEIELDFELALELAQGEKIVGDRDVVKVTKKSKFIATAPDDNS